jgi:hypothetical protein
MSEPSTGASPPLPRRLDTPSSSPLSVGQASPGISRRNLVPHLGEVAVTVVERPRHRSTQAGPDLSSQCPYVAHSSVGIRTMSPSRPRLHRRGGAYNNRCAHPPPIMIWWCIQEQWTAAFTYSMALALRLSSSAHPPPILTWWCIPT